MASDHGFDLTPRAQRAQREKLRNSDPLHCCPSEPCFLAMIFGCGFAALTPYPQLKFPSGKKRHGKTVKPKRF